MSRLTEYWENYDRFYDDLQKEGQNLDDLLIKNKFGFHNGKLTFSNKSKFNFGPKVAASHEYALKAKLSKGTAEFKVKNGQYTVETELDHFAKDQINVGSFANFETNNNSEGCNTNGKVHLRIHHKDNALLTVGVENLNLCTGAAGLLALGSSFGRVVDGNRVTFNSLVKYNLEAKHLALVSFFVKAKKGDTTGLFITNVNKKRVENDPLLTQEVDLALKVVKQVCPRTKVGGELTHDINTAKTNLTLVSSLQFDKVRVNAKLDAERALTLGITSVHDDLTLIFTAKAALQGKLEKVGEAEIKKTWVNHQFGVSAEFNRV